MSEPQARPTTRRPSHAPLVAGIRTEVDAWRGSSYVGTSATSRRLLEHWFLDEHITADGRPFRYYDAQREAIETLIYLFEVKRALSLAALVTAYADRPVPVAAQAFPRYVVKMATGSGKTKVMSLAVAWAYFSAVRETGSPLPPNALLIAPNLIVYERLREDFEAARIFRTDPVIPPEWRADFDLQVCLRDDPVPVTASGVLALSNIQALYERHPPEPGNPVDALLGPRPPANLSAPDPMLVQVARRGRLLVLDDEAHHVHDEIKRDTGEPLRWVQTLQRLHEMSGGVAAQLDFSATPKNQQGQIFAETVADYPLAQAIEDGIVKRPILGELAGDAEATSDDASVRYRQRIGAGVAKWREFRDALAPAGRKPLLFVMAEDTAAADQIAAYLDRLPDLAGKVLTIHVRMTGKDKGEVATADLEQARRWAREVDRDDNTYAAIVSVLMLREGWDVRNVTVIVPLRPLTAKAGILPEQTLGRGLRRMTPPGSHVDERVVVIEHEAFRQLWDEALDEEGLTGLVERTSAEEAKPAATVIAVDPERSEFDIEIPQLSRVLTRDASRLTILRPGDIPARQLRLPTELRSDTVNYTGRDLLTGEVVERAAYPLPLANDPAAVLAWYVNELQRDTRLTGQFALLAPLVRGYIEERAFGGPVDLGDPLVLQVLSEPVAQETILGALRMGVDAATTTTTEALPEPRALRLIETKPFLWSGSTASVTRSVFPVQPCDSGLEVRFCAFLDRCPDVEAFAKLAREVRFSLEYRAENGRLAYYYPDFVIRAESGDCYVVETKGLADLDVPHKDARARRWAADATHATGTRWRYVRVDEEVFDPHESDLPSFQALLDLATAHRRERYLAGTQAPRRRTRQEVLGTMAAVSSAMEGVSGVDEEISRFREDLGA